MIAPLANHHRIEDFNDNYHVVRLKGSRDWLLIYTKAGEGFCRGSNASTPLVPGDLLLLDPKFPQEYGRQAPASWDFLWVHFQTRPDWSPIIKSMPEIFPGHRLLKVPLKVRPLFVKILNEVIQNALERNSHADLCAMHQIERLFLAIYKFTPPKAGQPLDSRILDVIRYIEDHLHLPLHLEDLAARSGLSKYRLAHLFSAQMRETPHHYIMSLRIKKACDLLNTTALPIGEIAYQTGFSNPAHFGHQFTRRVRCSPGTYRLSGAAAIRPPQNTGAG